MFANEITAFLYEQVKKGNFDNCQRDLLNSMIDQIGSITNIAGINMQIQDFGEKFQEFGGNQEQFDADWHKYSRKNVRVRILQRIGHRVIQGGQGVVESANLIRNHLKVK